MNSRSLSVLTSFLRRFEEQRLIQHLLGVSGWPMAGKVVRMDACFIGGVRIRHLLASHRVSLSGTL